jgi:hypothetical protein
MILCIPPRGMVTFSKRVNEKKEEKWGNMKYVMSLLMMNSLKIAKTSALNFLLISLLKL